ncbi:AMP-binding protein [Natrialbaceae archaeon A-arb3/5]
MTNVVKSVQSAVMHNQEATAIDGEEPLSFAELWSRTDEFAGGLRNRGITAGDAVGIHLSNPHAFLIAFYGTLRNGCVPVTVPPSYDNGDVATVLTETESTALVTDKRRIMSILANAETLRVAVTVDADVRMGVDWSAFLENDGMNGSGSRTGIDLVSRGEDDCGLIAYVRRDESGPVGVAYTHSTLQSAATVGSTIQTDGEAVSHLGTLSLSNPIELLYGANAAIVSGGRYDPLPDGEPTTVRSVLDTTDIERTFVTPQQFAELREREADQDGITLLQPTKRATETAETATCLRGLPETGITHVKSPTDDASRLGDPLPDIETRVLETNDGAGELAIRGPTCMKEYVGRPEITDATVTMADGVRWIRTGLPVEIRNGEIVLDQTADPIRTSSATPS